MSDETPPFYQIEIFDPESLVEGIRGADLDARVLKSGPGVSVMDRVLLPGSTLDRVAISPKMLFGGTMPADCYTLVYIVECPTPSRAFNFMLDHVEGYIGVFPPGSVLDCVIPSGYRNGTMTIPTPEFHRYLEKYFPEGGGILRCGGAFRVGLAEQARLRASLDSVGHLLADPERPLTDFGLRSRLEQMLRVAYFDAMRSGIESMISKLGKRVERRYLRMRQVREYIEENFDKPIHLDDLCKNSGLSRRGVENLFNELMGIGAIAYLRSQRLNGARRALLDADCGPGEVKRIAYEWSFCHLGHFSRDYKLLFGELPSQTLVK